MSKVDETGSARGRLEPKGKTLKLDAPVAGTVAAIKVKEGQTVRRGQILLELESEIARTELQQAQAKLEGQLNRVTQLIAVKNQLEIAVRTQQQQSREGNLCKSGQGPFEWLVAHHKRSVLLRRKPQIYIRFLEALPKSLSNWLNLTKFGNGLIPAENYLP